MKKHYLTHILTFFLGVLFAYMLNDFSRLDESGVITKNDLRPQNQARVSGNSNADLFANSIANLMQRQIGNLAESMPGGINVHTEVKSGELVIYLKGNGIDKNSLKIDVVDGVFSVSGVSIVSQGNSSFTSSFNKSFSIPSEFDTNNPEMKVVGEEIIISFKKL